MNDPLTATAPHVMSMTDRRIRADPVTQIAVTTIDASDISELY
jgi:hypothetical protein